MVAATSRTKEEIVDQCLSDLNKRHGSVSPRLLLNEAKSPSHPLHADFDWDNNIAAEKWRLEQAAQIIRASKYVAFLNEKGEETLRVRKWVSIPGGRSEYREREKALVVMDVREDFIRRKISTLQAWCNETVDIEELQPLRKAILPKLKKFQS